MKKTLLSMIPSTPLNTVLCTALLVTLGVSVSACSGDNEAGAESGKVMAVDRVQQATDIAKANSPEAEDMGFAATAPMTTPDAEVDMPETTEEGTATATADMSEASATADTDVAADMPVEDNAAEPAAASADIEPAVSQ